MIDLVERKQQEKLVWQEVNDKWRKAEMEKRRLQFEKNPLKQEIVAKENLLVTMDPNVVGVVYFERLGDRRSSHLGWHGVSNT